MKPILEYIISKNNSTNLLSKQLNIIYNTYNLVFKEDINLIKDEENDLKTIIKDWLIKNDVKYFRIYYNSQYAGHRDFEKQKEFKDIEKYIFKNILDEERCFEDIIDNFGDNCSTEIEILPEIVNKDYYIYYDEFGICINNHHYIIMIEKVDNNDEINPSLKTYYGEGKRWLELSDKRILLELDSDVPDSFWDIGNSIIEDSVEGFNDAFGVDIHCLGRGGRHVCIEPTFINLHRYVKLVKEVEKEQYFLVKDLNNAIIDYGNE